MSPVHCDTLDDCDELEICALYPVLSKFAISDNELLVLNPTPATPLTPLLVHVIEVRRLESRHFFHQHFEVVPHDRLVEGLRSLWVKPRWLSELDLWVPVKKPVYPVLSNFSRTQVARNPLNPWDGDRASGVCP